MSLKLQFASVSLGAAVDQQTGNLSVFEVLEEVRTATVPIQLQALVISIALEKTQRVEFNGKVFIHFLTPDGKQQLVGQGDMRVPLEQRRMKAVFRYGAFPLMSFGQHRFVISWLNASNQKVGEAILDFGVVQTAPEQEQDVEVLPPEFPDATH